MLVSFFYCVVVKQLYKHFTACCTLYDSVWDKLWFELKWALNEIKAAEGAHLASVLGLYFFLCYRSDFGFCCDCALSSSLACVRPSLALCTGRCSLHVVLVPSSCAPLAGDHPDSCSGANAPHVILHAGQNEANRASSSFARWLYWGCIDWSLS